MARYRYTLRRWGLSPFIPRECPKLARHVGFCEGGVVTTTPPIRHERAHRGTSARLLPNRRQGRQAQWRVWILGTTA
jgi:hypothetical protein